MLAKHEMFEEIGGGETSKQGQEVESVSCQANNVGQFRQACTICVFGFTLTPVIPLSRMIQGRVTHVTQMLQHVRNTI